MENVIGNIAGAAARYNTSLMNKIQEIKVKQEDEQKVAPKDGEENKSVESTENHEEVSEPKTENEVVPNSDMPQAADGPNPHVPLPVDAPANTETTV